MKLRALVLIILLAVLYGHSEAQNTPPGKSGKIFFKARVVEPDSVLASFPPLISVMENSTGLNKPDYSEQYDDYTVNFYAKPEKGIVYVYFENLEKNVKPELKLTSTEGDVLHEYKAMSRLNVVNLREIPKGAYLLTAKVNADITTWEVEKE